MIPQSIIKPISETTLMSKPVIKSPINPPVKASGMVNIMMNGDFKLWNWATIIR